MGLVPRCAVNSTWLPMGKSATQLSPQKIPAGLDVMMPPSDRPTVRVHSFSGSRCRPRSAS